MPSTFRQNDQPTIRYRTEAFSGTQERDAAEVMAFETFELGNTDILEYLQENILKNSPICEKFRSFIKELEDNGYVDDMPTDEKVAFFKAVLDEIRNISGLDIKYALWLADLKTVKDFYGRDMMSDNDYESYEVGPVILSDLVYDGTLYGYVEYPISIEEREGLGPFDPKPSLSEMIQSASASRLPAAPCRDEKPHDFER